MTLEIYIFPKEWILFIQNSPFILHFSGVFPLVLTKYLILDSGKSNPWVGIYHLTPKFPTHSMHSGILSNHVTEEPSRFNEISETCLWEVMLSAVLKIKDHPWRFYSGEKQKIALDLNSIF